MKNIIYILVDALSSDNVGKKEYRNSTTPFLDSMYRNGIGSDSVLAMGPYTEAAWKSNLCGENTLDSFGYMRGVRDCKNCYAELLQQQGYYTYASYSPYIYSSSYVRGIDEYFYTRLFDFSLLYDYRLEYYGRQKDSLTIEEEDICISLVDEAFCTWMHQLEMLKERDHSCKLIYDLVDENKIEKNLNQIKVYYLEFSKSEKSFLYDILKLGLEHPVFSIPSVAKDTISIQGIPEEFREKIQKSQGDVTKLLRNNQKIDFQYLLNSFLSETDRIQSVKNIVKQYVRLYREKPLYSQMETSKIQIKKTINASKQLMFWKDIINNHPRNELFYCFIHIEDFHIPSMFFSYDCNDESIIKKELQQAVKYLEHIPPNYKGNIIADLSSLYVDQRIEEFYHGIDKEILENSVFVVSADHGYPDNFNPPRKSRGNNFYLENYKIPFRLIGNNIYSSSENQIYSSLDIFPSILKWAGVRNEVCYIGGEGRDYVWAEYLGGGCPDIFRRQIQYLFWDGKYKIGVSVGLEEEVKASNMKCIYDVVKDPYEKRNMILSMKKKKQVVFLLQKAKERHQFLKKLVRNGYETDGSWKERPFKIY